MVEFTAELHLTNQYDKKQVTHQSSFKPQTKNHDFSCVWTLYATFAAHSVNLIKHQVRFTLFVLNKLHAITSWTDYFMCHYFMEKRHLLFKNTLIRDRKRAKKKEKRKNSQPPAGFEPMTSSSHVVPSTSVVQPLRSPTSNLDHSFWPWLGKLAPTIDTFLLSRSFSNMLHEIRSGTFSSFWSHPRGTESLVRTERD